MMRDAGEEVIEIWGGLWELPPDIGDALDDPRLSECLLFHLQRYFDHFYGYMSFERWGHKYRIVKDTQKKLLNKKKKKESIDFSSAGSDHHHHQISNRTVLFVNSASYNHTENEEENASNYDAFDDADADAAETTLIEEEASITLPVTHLVIIDMHMPTEVIRRLNLDRITTLALPARFLGAFRHTLQQLAVASAASRLHLLIFRIDKEDRKKFVEALVHMCLSLRLQGLVLGSYFHQDSAAPALWSEVVGQLSSQGSQLEYLGMQVEASGGLPPITGLLSQLKQFRLIGIPGQALKFGIAASVQRLTRLDLCKCEEVSDDDIESLLEVITHDTSSKLLDLGLKICSSDTMKLLVASPALAKLPILRPFIDAESEEEETAILNQLAQGLSRLDCKVRFLDLQLQWKLGASFWHLLLESSSSSSRKKNSLEAMRIYPQVCVQVRGGLADWLRSQACSLVWLDCSTFMSTGSTFADVKEEWELANSLTSNFSVCTLAVCWKSLSAKAHANSLISRNQLYKSGQLLEEQVQPNAAKLFLCGHGTVGKTTLSQTLLAKRSSPLAGAACGLLGKPDRTRGMEFHSLSFEKGRPPWSCRRMK